MSTESDVTEAADTEGDYVFPQETRDQVRRLLESAGLWPAQGTGGQADQ